MAQLMQGRAVPVDRLEIGLRRRDHHEVRTRRIEGAVAADAEVDAGRPDQRLDPGLDQARQRRWRDGRNLGRQVFALGGVEDCEPFQERDCGRFLAGLAGASLLVIRHKAVGIDDGGAVLALAHIAAERERLAKGQPALCGEAVLDHGAPEDQDVDPRILPAGGRVLRHGKRRLRRGRPPGLDPGHAAGLQFSDDLAGDFVIERRPVVAGAR